MSLVSQVTALFMQAWRAYGKPVISVAPPVASWSLPAGYAFDDQSDGIVTAGGATITDLDGLSAYFAEASVYIVPIRSDDDTRVLIAAGVIPSGALDVKILAADVATVKAAFAVEVDGEWFNVDSVAVEPSGATSGWAKVRLVRRS